MTAESINYRKKAREDFINNTTFDDAFWEALQEVLAEIAYENAVRKYLRERSR